MDAPRGVEFEPVSLATPGLAVDSAASRLGGRLAIAGWLVVLGGVIAVAVAGRMLTPEPRNAVIEFAARTDPLAPTTATPPPLPTPDLLVLSSPAYASATVTTRELLVQGFLRAPTGTIRITLEARGNRVIDEATMQSRVEGWRAPGVERLARFEVRFGLPNPRPNGRMIVQVAAYTPDGAIIDVVRRPFLVGPLLDGSLGPTAALAGG